MELDEFVKEELAPARLGGAALRLRRHRRARAALWPLVRTGLTGRPHVAESVATVLASLDIGGERAAHYRRLLDERAASKGRRWKSGT